MERGINTLWDIFVYLRDNDATERLFKSLWILIGIFFGSLIVSWIISIAGPILGVGDWTKYLNLIFFFVGPILIVMATVTPGKLLAVLGVGGVVGAPSLSSASTAGQAVRLYLKAVVTITLYWMIAMGIMSTWSFGESPWSFWPALGALTILIVLAINFNIPGRFWTVSITTVYSLTVLVMALWPTVFTDEKPDLRLAAKPDRWMLGLVEQDPAAAYVDGVTYVDWQTGQTERVPTNWLNHRSVGIEAARISRLSAAATGCEGVGQLEAVAEKPETHQAGSIERVADLRELLGVKNLSGAPVPGIVCTAPPSGVGFLILDTAQARQALQLYWDEQLNSGEACPAAEHLGAGETCVLAQPRGQFPEASATVQSRRDHCVSHRPAGDIDANTYEIVAAVAGNKKLLFYSTTGAPTPVIITVLEVSC